MNNILLDALLDRIFQATKEEINPLLNAVTERFEEVYPGWELLSITVHGHEIKDRKEALQKSIDLLSHNENDLP